MYKGRTLFGLIPARGESKELPKKNIKPILGKPLISWTIKQALSSKYLDKVIVSTDNDEIAEISRNYGAEVPFIRPAILATNSAKMIDTILHAVNWLKTNDRHFDLIMLLQPTSPLRITADINNSIELLFKKNAQAIVSICQVNHHPYWSNELPKNGCMLNFIRPEIMNKNRQDLPVYYRLNGAIYLAYCDYLKERKKFFGEETFCYIMPKERSIDIDSEIEFKLAELIMRENSYQE